MASVGALVFQTSFALILPNVWTAQDFKKVQQCPKTAAEWTSASLRKACQSQATPDYQCAAIEDNVGKFGEICTKKGLSQANKCAVLNSQTYNLDYADCKAPSDCPTTAYPSTEIYKFPICYGNFYGSTMSTFITTENGTTSKIPSTEKMNRPPSETGTGTGAIIGGVVFGLVLIILTCIILYCKRRTVMKMLPQNQNRSYNIHNDYMWPRQGWYDRLPKWLKDESEERNEPEMEPLEEGNVQNNGDRKKQVGLYLEPIRREPIDPNVIYSKPIKKGPVDSIRSEIYEEDERTKQKRLEKRKIQNMKTLQKYLVKILTNELDIKDLKEKTIIYNKSLVEHCGEVLVGELQKTESKNDFDNFDKGLVYLLLTNFCSNINPPSTGWDFEPLSEDLSIGADIERVRLLWNKMCDRDSPEINLLTDVKNRMERIYGAIRGVYDEEFDEMRIKIQHVMLKPDCIAEDGVVITKEIKSILTLLNDSDIVICRGVIGCGKTTLMNYIAKIYGNNGWTIRKENENITDENIVVKEDQKILLCCDNFLGSFYFNSLTNPQWLEMEHLLDEQRRSTRAAGAFKMLVLIHQHVYDELPKQVQQKLLQHKNHIMGTLSRAEMLIIFKQQMESGHCIQDSKCWFSNIDFEAVETKLKPSIGIIGNPALTLVCTRLHELFSDESFSKSPILALEQYFEKMRTGKSELFYILVYIMLVKRYRLGDDLEDWSGDIHPSVTKANIEKNIDNLNGFIQRKEPFLTIIHEVMYIALFRVCFEQHKDMLSVLRFCDFTTLLQLVRPTNVIEATNQFTAALPKIKKEDKKEDQVVVKALAKRISKNEEFYSLIQKHPLNTDQYLKSKVADYHDSTKIKIGSKTMYIKN